MRIKRYVFIIVVLLLVGAAAGSAWLLVVDEPRKSDVIVVLAGETDRRPARALELLDQGYAGKLILDVPNDKIYQWVLPELARKYVEGLPEAAAITICPISGLSTKEESHDVARCLGPSGSQDVLLVTSDYHTRRALSVFQREMPTHGFSVAAAFDPAEFGVQWWRHREWAKVNLYEWMRLVWWEAVDRWR